MDNNINKSTSSLANKYKSLDEPIRENRLLPPNMILCRWCKQTISKGSKKCPHCNEYQNEADKKKAEDTSYYKYSDVSFSGLDIALLFVVIVIDFMLGTIYSSVFAFVLVIAYEFLSTTAKGNKFLKYSIAILIFDYIIKFLLVYSLSRH